ncbi:tumor necrosis factor receptor superfamily member 6B [Clinocottus analis]|uniref:tumor necrosis factor receptor superfamily member 6B n=1 Tax=Clinocottus analis TaxID=304258 RepID=UPI0035C1E815
MTMVCPSLLLPALLLLLSARAPRVAGVAAPLLTFRDTDPVTGNSVECDRCPPGTYLRSSCTATSPSVCAPCPSGSYTQLWNYINKCLRCGVCGHNQAVKEACAADRDCRCECKQGYFKRDYEVCHRHRDCPAGQGVLSPGTADADTTCHSCSNGTFSDSVSAHSNCSLHKGCDAPGLQLVLKGSSWHDSVCTSCRELRSTDGGDYLKEILPAFFVHQRIHMKRLRRILQKLPTEGGRKTRASGLGLADLQAHINAWVASATATQIRQVPAILTRVGADGAGERLQNKLQRIDSNLQDLCDPRIEGDVIVVAG